METVAGIVIAVGVGIVVWLVMRVWSAFWRGASQAPGTSGTPSRHYDPSRDGDGGEVVGPVLLRVPEQEVARCRRVLVDHANRADGRCPMCQVPECEPWLDAHFTLVMAGRIREQRAPQ